MSKIGSFLRLDYMTVKPYFKAVNLLIYGAIALFLSLTSGTITSGVGVGIMLCTLFLSYPFVVGEKHNMDALYITLSVSRNAVVAGRYLFTLLLNVCLILGTFVLSSAGFIVTGFLGLTDNVGVLSRNDGFLVLAALMLVVQAVQLPIYFKLGYTRAKFISIVPLAVIVAGFFAFTGVAGDSFTIIARTLEYLAVLAILLVIVFVSYKLSVLFYKKREF